MSRKRVFRVAVRKFAPFESAIRKQWEAFESASQTGLTLEAEALDLHPLMDNFFHEGGLIRGDWDVAFIDTDWLAAIHEAKSVVNLAPLIAERPPQDFPSAWTPSLLRLQEIDNAILGLPFRDGPECLIYRKDLFENPSAQSAYQQRFGAPLRVPQTWVEFHQVAKFFQKRGNGLFGTVFAAFPDQHNTVYDFLLQLWTRGGELINSAGEVQLESPAAIEAVAFYRSILGDSSAVHPRCREMDSVKSGMAFAAGEIAMVVNWFGFAAMAETTAESKVRGRVDIAPIPHAADSPTTSLNVYWLLSIAAGSVHPQVAYEFLCDCASAEMDKLSTDQPASAAVGRRGRTRTLIVASVSTSDSNRFTGARGSCLD